MGMVEEVEVEATEPLAAEEEGEPLGVGTTGRAGYPGIVFWEKTLKDLEINQQNCTVTFIFVCVFIEKRQKSN